MLRPGESSTTCSDARPAVHSDATAKLPAPAKVRRILLIALPSLGDILLCTPLISALRQQYPSAKIDVLAHKGPAAVLQGNPEVSDHIEVQHHPSFREYAWQAWRLIGRYDLAVSNGLSTRAAIYAFCSARFSASISALPGARRHTRARRLRQINVPYDSRCHTVTLMRRLGESLGLNMDHPIVPPQDSQSATRVDPVLSTRAPGQRLAVLHPTPGVDVKRWAPQSWQHTASALVAQGWHVLVTGGHEQAELAHIQACFEGTGAHSIAGELRLADLSELLGQADLFIGVDTLASHMAAALGTPTVVLFGPSDPVIWGPWPQHGTFHNSPYPGAGSHTTGNVQLLQVPHDCIGARSSACKQACNGGGACMTAISAPQVLAAVERATTGNAPKV